MKTAIIFGFRYMNLSYQYDHQRTPLPGIVIDIYMIYTFLKKNDYEHVYVITDIKEDVKPDELIGVVTRGQVNSNIFSFIENLIKSKEICFYQNLSQMTNFIHQHLNNVDKLFFYYTGHATQNYLMLPIMSNFCSIDEDDDDEKIRTSEFIKMLLQEVNSSCQVLMLFDCCYASNFGLPFNMDSNGVYRLNKLDSPIFTKKEIVCFVSSMHDQESHSTYNGSLFTRIAVNSLSQHYTDWLELLQEVQNNLNDTMRISNSEVQQTIRLYSSLPNIHSIWNWLNFKNKFLMSWQDDNLVLEIKLPKNLEK